MVVHAKSFKEALIVYGPMLAGIIIFGFLGIYIDIGIHLGWKEANVWALSCQINYPSEMLQDNNRPIGNYIGLFVGLFMGWLSGKIFLLKYLDA